MRNFNYDTYCGLYCGACDILVAYQKGQGELIAKHLNIEPSQIKCHGCNNRVQVYLDGKRMVIEPVSEQEDIFDFTGQIKDKLEKEGYTGHELAVKLAQQKQLVEKAFAQIITEAEEEYSIGKTVSHEELFADLDGED